MPLTFSSCFTPVIAKVSGSPFGSEAPESVTATNCRSGGQSVVREGLTPAQLGARLASSTVTVTRPSSVAWPSPTVYVKLSAPR